MLFEEPKVEFIEIEQIDTTTTSCAREANMGSESCIGSDVKPNDPECEDCATGDWTT